MVDVKKIAQATTIVTALTLIVKGVGFAEKILLAYFFGTGIEVDAYLIAYSIPFSAYIVLREVVKPAFLPTFLHAWRTSDRDAWRLFSVIGTVLLLLLGTATGAGMLLAEPLVSLTAPGFTGQQYTLAVRLTRLAMPALLFLGLSTLTTAALNAQKRFALPAIGDALFRAGPLLLLLSLGGIQGLALGVILGALGKLLVETFGLGTYLARIRPALDLALASVRTVGRLAAPLLAALFLSLFVAPLVENAFASKVGVGGVAALAYARKIVETLTMILPYTLGLVLLPFSTELAAGKDDRALAGMFSTSVRALILLFLPITLGLMVLREPFVQLLFERGAFTTASTQLTAGPLFFYALALVPFALEVVVIQFFFARQDTLTPVLTDVGAFGLNVVLIPLLMPIFGLGGIPLAAALAKALKVLLLLILFGRQVPAFSFTSLLPFSGKMALASLVTAGVLGLLDLMAGSLYSRGLIALVACLSVSGVVGGGVFYATAYLLRVNEIRRLWLQGSVWLRNLFVHR